MARHNELCDKIVNLAGKSFTPTHVRNDPEIYTGYAVHRGKENIKESPSNYLGELKGYLLIKDLWTQGTVSIHNTRVVDTDAT